MLPLPTQVVSEQIMCGTEHSQQPMLYNIFFHVIHISAWDVIRSDELLSLTKSTHGQCLDVHRLPGYAVVGKV